MKSKLTILFLMFFIYNITKAQNDWIYYIGQGVDMVIFGSQNQEENRIPFGKDVEMIYDKFFKSWNIIFTDRDYTKKKIKFSFITNLENGARKVQDLTGVFFCELNSIDTHGILQFMSLQLIENKKYSIIIYGISLKSN